MNDDSTPVQGDIALTHPTAADGADLYRIARDSRTLDLNSSYSYVLWCNDFGESSVVARSNGEVVGFITGYRRPTQTLMIWQVAVDARFRRRGLGLTMLEWLADAAARYEPRELIVETTVAPGNTASRAMFAKFAERRAMELEELPGFGAELFPDDHEPEPLLRMTPVARPSAASDSVTIDSTTTTTVQGTQHV